MGCIVPELRRRQSHSPAKSKEGQGLQQQIQYSGQQVVKEISENIPKFPPAFAANIGLETVVDGKHENTAIPVMNSLMGSGAI
jgi:hypothetical protein